jgi:hypothetical protein
MTNPAFKMSYTEKQERHSQKRACLLQFLASGEVYTTLPIAAQLLQASERTTLRLLQKLAEEKLLKIDLNVMPHTNLKLYGISEFGLAMTENANPKAKPFMLSRTNPSWVQHHTDGQLIRIKAETAGWKNYVPGKLLMVANTARLKKLPDALVSRPDGRGVAIEIERYVKSRKRMVDVISAHLSQIIEKKYDFVYYFTPHKPALDRAFAAVNFVTLDTKKIQLAESHRARFKTFDLSKWNGEM